MSQGKRGRPNKLTPEIQAKICDAIRAGAYVETAAALAGISKDTFYRWLKKGARAKSGKFKAFNEAVHKAMAEAEFQDIMIIANAAKVDWKAAAWKLERKYPERWARKDRSDVNLNHSGEVSKNETHEITFGLSEQLENDPESVELAKQLLRRRFAIQSDGED